MPNNNDENKATTSAHLPREIWFDILNRLTLTDLAIVSQASPSFSSLAESTINLFRRHDSPFSSKRDSSHGLVGFEPALCTGSSNLIAFMLHRERELRVFNMATGETVAALDDSGQSLARPIFSHSGNFIALCDTKKIRIYTLDLAEGKLLLRKKVSFGVKLAFDEMAERYIRTGQLFVGFSRDEGTIALAQLSFPKPRNVSGPPRHLLVECLTLSLRDSEEFEVLSFGNMRPPMARTFSVEVDPDVRPQLWDIELNSDPLRIFIPPGCVRQHGLLLDPSNPDQMVSMRIMEEDPQLGRFVHCRFSSCGQYFLGAWEESSGETSKVTIRKFCLRTSLYINTIKIPMVAVNPLLKVLFSQDDTLAVLVYGEMDRNSPITTAWQAVNLCGQGFVTVKCKQSIRGCEDFSTNFNLSVDGQLLSVALPCEVRGDNAVFSVRVFETATGLSIDDIESPVPVEVHLRYQQRFMHDLMTHHAFGGGSQPTLALYIRARRLYISYGHPE